MLLPVHVIAGGLAIILGAAALLAKKGGLVHRRAGLVFVAAMLVMGISGSVLGYLKDPGDSNVFGGLMTVYFVGTALTTVRPVASWTRPFNAVMLLLVIVLACADIVFGVQAFNSPRGTFNGVPFAMFFFLATIKLLAAAGDVRVWRLGMPRGGKRLARQLWRMCFAL